MVVRIVENKMCEVCGKNEAVVLCNGCDKALCKNCRIFDLWAYGCGSGDSKAFCKKCYHDPEINVWKGLE